jgi:4-coumarate--CoA ligase
MVNVPVVIMTRFDPNSFCATIAKYKITVAPIVPPVLVVLARHAGKLGLMPLYFRSHVSQC